MPKTEFQKDVKQVLRKIAFLIFWQIFLPRGQKLLLSILNLIQEAKLLV